MTNLPENIQDLAYQAITETFEGLAFLELTPDSEPLTPENCPSSLWASVKVLKPVEGEIIVILPEGLGNEIAGSLYNIFEGPIPDDKLKDILGEIANTAAGKILGLILPSETFKLGMPESGKGFPSISGARCFSYLTDDERRLGITLSLK